tara:strand:- start:541 stop:1839 length:1299 start_codon:yes stop_codon:yes gene_type:complete
MFIKKMNLPRLFIVILLICSGSFIYADDNKSSINAIWQDIKTNSRDLVEKSIKISSDLAKQMSDAVDAELKALNSSPKIDIQDKIDNIRIRVGEISGLKKEEINASSFTLISKSKKDYRIDIDEVLQDIEHIIFDGEIVDYASRIRYSRLQISNLKREKASLNEDLVFAPVEGTLLKSSKEDIREKIKDVDDLIKKTHRLIDEFEFDLKRKLNALGINLTREQIRVMTTRVDGDELSKSFAIFDVTKQISETLAILVKENNFSGETTVKYYGTYVVLSEILGYSQREYMRKIKELYLPSLDKIADDINGVIEFSEESIDAASVESNRKILRSNIESNKFSLMVVNTYRKILEKQYDSLESALERTNEQITVAYSTYDTAANAANLINLINETQDSFNRILDMQVPDIIPFENTELELKFQEISDKIIIASDQ